MKDTGGNFSMDKKQIKANFLLLLTAAVWGLAFVAQKLGSEHVGAFTFNGIRFMLGALSLLPIIYTGKRKKGLTKEDTNGSENFAFTLKMGIIIGSILFLGAGLQQFGMAYTTASKAGFITGLYIVLVPVVGTFLRQVTGINTWFGVGLAFVGLYLLSINKGFTMEFGDLLMLCSSFAFTAHILVIDYATKRVDSISLSCVQFFTCAFLNIICAVFFEDIAISGILKAGVPILYGGLLSVGVGYTLQVVAQKDAKPSHAAILMSMESVFSCLGGMLILKERLSPRGMFGCLLIFIAIIISQLPGKKARHSDK